MATGSHCINVVPDTTPPQTLAEAADFDQLPIVLGVTGHIDIDPAAGPALRQAFNEILDNLTAQYPDTPLIVVCGLAAGADLIAAEAAIERNIRVLAALPSPQSVYEQSFKAQTDLDRFRITLSKCWRKTVIGKGTDAVADYDALGSFLAYYSTILVAFWDGMDGRGKGGTADVIRLRETGEGSSPSPNIIQYIPDVGPIFEIATPREGGEPTATRSGSLTEKYPERPYLELVPRKRKNPKAPEDDERLKFEAMLRNLDRFNKDIAAETADANLTPLERLQDRADKVATRFQDWTLATLRTQYVLGAVAGAVQITLVSPVPISPGLATAVRLGVLAIAFAAFRFAKRLDFENRYQDYRSIAEGLRVQLAWCCGGLHDRLAEASYLQMQQSELQWIRLALRTAYLVSGARDLTDAALPDPSYAKQWLEGQVEYYKKSALSEEQKHLKSGRNSAILSSVAGAVVAIAVLLSIAVSGVGPVHFQVVGMHINVPHWSLSTKNIHMSRTLLNKWLAWGSAIPAALAGMLVLLLRFYTQQRGFMENARRYQHMYVVFESGRLRLEANPAAAPKLLAELGHEALSEHASWLTLHRERPMHFIGG